MTDDNIDYTIAETIYVSWSNAGVEIETGDHIRFVLKRSFRQKVLRCICGFIYLLRLKWLTK
jgi:formylmethanofuran dehydrogenase subunit A